MHGASDSNVYELLDEIVTKALKLVFRAVRFWDIWEQESASEEVDYEDGQRPLTPPKDVVHPQRTSSCLYINTQISCDTTTVAVASSVLPTEPGSEAQAEPLSPRRKRASHLSPIGSAVSSSAFTESLRSPTSPSFATRSRASVISHRLSYQGPAAGPRNENLASEKLCSAHDSFIGFIGSFIGLHLQSRSSADFLNTTQQSVTSCRKLLAVLEAVWERDGRRADQLEAARETMLAKLTELVSATKELLTPAEDDTVFMPDHGVKLVSAATGCVRAAGDCVTKTRSVIEKIGDFEFEIAGTSISDSIFAGFDDHQTQEPEPVPATSMAVAVSTSDEKPLPAPPATSPMQLELISIPESKPLPEPPALSPISIPPNDTVAALIVESPMAVSFRSSISSAPPISHLPIPQLPAPELSPTDSTNSPVSSTQRFFGQAFRHESVNISVTDSTSTYPNSSIEDDATSIRSRPSTRATTPEHSPSTYHRAEPSLTSSFDSSLEGPSKTSEEDANLETELLTKTYVHELIYNKDGQISGGSLPALIEQLTTHEAAPDVMFVTTFYLTFRLFTTPLDFANCLIDRFDYVGHTGSVSGPVRLRVFNVFKGWLESHWQAETDSSALGVILTFATGKLRSALPRAGKHLAELTSRVTEVRAGALVPRQISSLGKTSTSSTIWSATEGTAPTPAISKGQLNALRSAATGGSICSILDFEPIELARQLTVIESRLFCAIQPEELLLSEKEKKDENKGVNVKAMSTLSTDLANLVAESILSLEEPKKRALVIKQWVKVSMKCLELNNYDSLMAIICSLNSAMIHRLKRTWELVSQKTKGRLEELQNIISVERNYAVLRLRLQNHIAPCIPFVGIYLTDLTFNDVGNQTTRQLPGDGSGKGVSVINFDKHMRTAKIIGQLQRFQVPYKLVPVPEMQEWMESQIQRVRNSDQANVQNYYRRSLILEPRTTEKFAKPVPVENYNPLTLTTSNSSTHQQQQNPKEKFEFLSAKFQFITSTNSKDKSGASS
jgi:hypothetical protein